MSKRSRRRAWGVGRGAWGRKRRYQKPNKMMFFTILLPFSLTVWEEVSILGNVDFEKR